MQPTHNVEGHMDFDVQIDKGADGNTVVTHNYCTDLFHPRTAEKFAAQYLAALRAICMPEWADVETWKIPHAPDLVDQVDAAAVLSPEGVVKKLAPVVAAVLQPVSAAGASVRSQALQDTTKTRC